ncbi:transposable element Tcb1 transposase [Trichonephila clavipes]|nr:transposable element Tcb1 transposase [Trichonephila clavipes]
MFEFGDIMALNHQHYICEELEPVVLPCIQRLTRTILQQDNARPHVARNVQEFFFSHQIELLPWSSCSPDLSLIENLRSILAQQLTLKRPPAATPDQLWQYVEAAWRLLYPKDTYKASLILCQGRVAAFLANNGGYTSY